MTSLLSLPLPIRERIWEMVILCEVHSIQLLTTCRQINMEAKGIPYRRPHIFSSQAELASWIQQVDSKHLDQVEDISLYLQDLEVIPLDAQHTWPEVSLLELYEFNIPKILADISKLPNIQHFALYKPDKVRSYLYRDFYSAALNKILLQLPALRTLKFHSDDDRLDFLKTLPDLRHLAFTGHAKNTPMETLNILSRLRHLTNIELIPSVTPDVAGGAEWAYLSSLKSLSLTRDVIKGLRGLKNFTIYESGDENTQTWSFFSQSFLQALDSGNRTSLQRLRVVLDSTPNAETQKSFQALLAASSLKHVDVSWPLLDADLIHNLPRTVETLCITPSTARPPYWMLIAVHSRKSHLPVLREVQLIERFGSNRLTSEVCTTNYSLWQLLLLVTSLCQSLCQPIVHLCIKSYDTHS
jgi:hypothetical protein